MSWLFLFYAFPSLFGKEIGKPMSLYDTKILSDDSAAHQLLLVEDDPHLGEMLSRGLGEEGYQVNWIQDGAQAIVWQRSHPADLIILDWMLPGKDGLAVCRAVRASGSTVPILLLTVKNEPEDRVKGLDAGADDFLGKPFSFDELLARLRAHLRRVARFEDRYLRVEDLTLDTVTRKAFREGKEIELTGKEFALLEYLLRRPGEVISEQELVTHVWGLDFDPKTNLVSVYVHHLRRKIDQPFATTLLHTVRKRGYRLGNGS